MTIPRYAAMMKYWENSPPVHLMVAAYFGIGKKKEGKKADNATAAELNEFMNLSMKLNTGA